MAAPFVEVAWLRDRLHDPGVRIVDARSRPHGPLHAHEATGAEQYATGHISGAIQLDYADQLADPATPHAARIAPPALFARVLGERGIGDAHTVVAYDTGETPYAARFVWMCRYYGHDAAVILAGGYPAWQAAGLPATLEAPAYAVATFTPHARPQIRASREEVLAVANGRSDAQLIDTQRNRTYAERDRDIRGARRLAGNLLLDDAQGGRIVSDARLAELVASMGLDRSKRTIVSCGSGVSASGTYLALLEAGFDDVAVYDGSWLEWDHDGLPTVPKDG